MKRGWMKHGAFTLYSSDGGDNDGGSAVGVGNTHVIVRAVRYIS